MNLNKTFFNRSREELTYNYNACEIANQININVGAS